MRIITYCENDFEAQLIVGRLENEGIRAVVLNSAISRILPLPGNRFFSAKVAVHDEDFLRAIEVLELDESEVAGYDY